MLSHKSMPGNKTEYPDKEHSYDDKAESSLYGLNGTGRFGESNRAIRVRSGGVRGHG